MLAHDDRGTGDVLVLIHGHPFDRRMWAPQLESLSGTFRVIAVDLPGYGGSAGPGGKVLMSEFADAVTAHLDELGVDRFTACGLSMGGLVAMELALGHAGRLDGVIFAATTAAPVDEGEAETRRAAADAIERDGVLDVAAQMVATLFGPAARRDNALVTWFFSMMLDADPAGAAAALRGRAERPDYSRLLGGVSVPALVIAGDHDHFASEEVTQQLIAALPSPEVLRMPGCGHLPNLEDQERFDEGVRRFMKR